MKKIVQIISILFIMCSFTYAQGITITIGTKTANPGEILSVPIDVTNFNNIGAISLQIQYDPSVLTYSGVENQPVAGNFTQNAANNVITIGWFSTTAMNLGNGKLVDLKFTYTGGTSDLTFKSSGCEIANSGGSVLAVNYVNGNVSGVVPVELASFRASANGSVVTLSWRTVTETNNARFEVERRMNDQDWMSAGSVAGKGTTSEVTDYSFTDKVSGYTKLSYRLKQIDLDGTFTYSKEVELTGAGSAKEYSLNQNYPNPFNPATKISYSIPSDSRVILTVYTITGEFVSELINSNQSAGSYTVDFNAGDLANGMYIYKIQAGNFVQSRKMLLIK